MATDAAKAQEAKGRGNAHFKGGKWEDAIAEYTEAIKLDGTQHSFYSNRSACYASLDKFDEALKDGEKCIELKPDWPKGYSRKGLALFKLGKIKDALETYDEGLKQDSTNKSLMDGKAQCIQAMQAGDSQQQAMMAAFGKLASDPRTKDLLKDPEIMPKITKLFTNPMEALMDPTIGKDEKMKPVLEILLPLIMQMQSQKTDQPGGGDAPPAPKPAEKKKEKTPPPKEPTPPPKEKTPAELKNDEAKVLYKKKDFEGALGKYYDAVALEPESPQYICNVSAVLFMQGKLDDAEAACNKTIEIAQKDFQTKWISKASNRLASIEEKRGDLVKAIQYLKNSLLETTDYKVKERLRKLEKKKKQLDAEAYLDPEKALEHKKKGNEFFKAAKWPEAVKEYTEAIKRDPKNHKIYSNRATCYSKLMAFDQAMKDCEKCLQIEPKWVKALVRKGRIHHFRKQYHKAKTAYNKAFAIEPTNGELQKFMAETNMAVQANQGKEVDEKEQRKILNDPEIQKILRDPEIDFILKRAQADPSIIQKALQDPVKAAKIQTLFDAGVIRTG